MLKCQEKRKQKIKNIIGQNRYFSIFNDIYNKNIMRKKWNKEKIIKTAEKYTSMKEFFKYEHQAYIAAQKRKMLYNELNWLKRDFEYHQKGYWTKEKAIEESKKYTRLYDFMRDNKGLYEKMRKKGWLTDVPWLKKSINEVGFWTEEKILEESKKFNTKAEFKFYSQVAYNKAREMKLFEKMPWLRIKNVSKVNDCVYGYFFEDFKTVYIGRTIERRLKTRDKEHRNPKKNDSVYKFSIENDIPIPNIKIIESGLTVFDGSEREKYWEKYYSENGYKTLNIAKCGSLGSLLSGKWNEATITEEAKKYKSRNEFRKGNQPAYYASIKLGLLESFDWLSSRNHVRKGYWCIKDNVINEAKKYTSRREFQKKCCGAYHNAKKNNYFDEMPWLNDKRKNKK